MAFEPVYEKINGDYQKEEVIEQIKVETRSDLACEEIKKILSVSAFVTTDEGVFLDGKVEYSGRINFFISYLSVSGEIKKTECGSEFKGIIKSNKIGEDCRGYLTASVEKTDADLNGIKLSLVAYLSVMAEIEKSNQTPALVGGEDMFVKSEEITYSKGLGLRVGAYPVEEQFEVNYLVKEVLSHKATAHITAVQCGVGTIIIDGEVLLSIIMLQNKEKGGIIRESKTIPFRMELECEDAMPSMQATARVKERSFKTDISVDEEKCQSTINVSVQLQFYGEAYSVTQVSVAKDAFCKHCDVELSREQLPCAKSYELHCYSAMVGGRALVDQLPVGATVLAVGGERVEIVSKECDGGEYKITGVLEATVYFADGEGNYFTRKAQTPFEIKERLIATCNSHIKLNIHIASARAKILSLTEIELEADLKWSVCLKESQHIDLIKEIKQTKTKLKCDSALSVYIPIEGEDLWSLAKRLNESPEHLVETNKDLCFPLTGKERIVVYRRK